MTVGLAAAVTAPSAVSVISDAAADAGSQVASNWLVLHPEWGGVAMIGLALLAAGIEWLRQKAKATDTQADDVLLATAAKTLEQTQAELKKDG